MKEKTYLLLLKGGVIASLFIVFLVSKDLLFPYITTKQFSFNILTEMLFALWLVFIMRFPAFRPKKNLITYGLIAYLLAILASCAVSADINLSIWGDAERMLGLFHVAHFFLLYLIIISVFHTWKDWKFLMISSVSIAAVVSLVGLLGKDVYSTIGNTAYVSGYLIFNFFFAAILFFREQGKSLRFVYAIPVILMFIEFWRCHTSGAIIGLFLSVMLFFFLLGLFHDSKKIRRLSLISFAAIIIIVVAVFSQYKSDWFQSSFLKNLTPQKMTFQTRLISWKSAAKDFKNHPIFGTGFGNYAIVFDKHFDSKFYDYTATETYFDRAHNNLIDIVSTTGLVGLIAYLSIFAALFYYLFSQMKRNGWRAGTADLKHRKNLEIIILISLVSAYFIQNLAIFDSLVTYMGLMITLGFAYWIVFQQDGELEEKKKPLIKNQSVEIFILIIFLLVAYTFTSVFNIRPRRTLEKVIVGYSQILSGQIEPGMETFKSSLKGKPLERDGRVVLINLVSTNPNIFASVKPEKAAEYIDYVISLAEKNVSYNPYDSLMQMQLAQILDMAARYYGNDNIVKASEYSGRALNAMNYSVEASPGRGTVYLARAQMHIIRGENEEGLADVRYAIGLNQNYYEGYCRLAQFDSFLKITDGFAEALDKCVDLGGDKNMTTVSFMTDAINYYISVGDFDRAIKLGIRVAELNSDDAGVQLNLAKLYFATGKEAETQAALDKANKINPDSEAMWQEFLKAYQGE